MIFDADLNDEMSAQERASLSLVELRESKIAKYDIALKQLFSLQNGTLRKILAVPDGQFLREEFPGFEFRRADALVYENGTIHHVEFQSKNDRKIPARMHEYAYLIDKYRKTYGVKNINKLRQKVVYLGHGSNTMLSPFQRWGTVHNFESFRLSEKFSDSLAVELLKSTDINDWIVGLLVLPPDHYKTEYLFRLARKIGRWTAASQPQKAEFKVLLLIAALLRNLRGNELEKLENMLSINVGESGLLRHIYDDGNNEHAARLILDRVESALESEELYIDDSQRHFLSTFSPERLLDILVLASSGEHEKLLKQVTPPSMTLKLSQSSDDD
jgi:hypothetical protein